MRIKNRYWYVWRRLQSPGQSNPIACRNKKGIPGQKIQKQRIINLKKIEPSKRPQNERFVFHIRAVKTIPKRSHGLLPI
jgi:hypothetical protein